jgi:hypothetical protein
MTNITENTEEINMELELLLRDVVTTVNTTHLGVTEATDQALSAMKMSYVELICIAYRLGKKDGIETARNIAKEVYK